MLFSYDEIDCGECATRFDRAMKKDGPKFVPCDKHLKQLDGTGWNADYVAGVAQAAEHLIRTQEREVSSTFASPRFEQVSRCIK